MQRPSSHCLNLPITGEHLVLKTEEGVWEQTQQYIEDLKESDLAWLPPPVKSDHEHYMVQKDPDQTYPPSILSDIGFKRDQ